jgi:hypothetical protein
MEILYDPILSEISIDCHAKPDFEINPVSPSAASGIRLLTLIVWQLNSAFIYLEVYMNAHKRLSNP